MRMHKHYRHVLDAAELQATRQASRARLVIQGLWLAAIGVGFGYAGSQLLATLAPLLRALPH